MAHYALLDENDIVVNVIVGKNEGDDGVDWERRYAEVSGLRCRRTSYNTKGGVHAQGKSPYRMNYAGIGYRYDAALDAFIPPKPFESWVLDVSKCLWEAPVPFPDDGLPYRWDEPSVAWVEIPVASADDIESSSGQQPVSFTPIL
jgi:hypothetical protein